MWKCSLKCWLIEFINYGKNMTDYNCTSWTSFFILQCIVFFHQIFVHFSNLSSNFPAVLTLVGILILSWHYKQVSSFLTSPQRGNVSKMKKGSSRSHPPTVQNERSRALKEIVFNYNFLRSFYCQSLEWVLRNMTGGPGITSFFFFFVKTENRLLLWPRG